MADYLTVTEMKTRLELPATTHDARLALAITAASRAVDRWCARPDGGFVASAQTRTYDVPATTQGVLVTLRDPDAVVGGRITVPAAVVQVLDIDPLVSITSLSSDQNFDGTFETTHVRGTDYDLWPLNAANDGRPWTQVRTLEWASKLLPVGQKRVQIVGSFGEGTTAPAPIVEATYLLANRLFHRRTSPYGVTGDFSVQGGLQVLNQDPDVQRLLIDAGYRDLWVLA